MSAKEYMGIRWVRLKTQAVLKNSVLPEVLDVPGPPAPWCRLFSGAAYYGQVPEGRAEARHGDELGAVAQVPRVARPVYDGYLSHRPGGELCPYHAHVRGEPRARGHHRDVR